MRDGSAHVFSEFGRLRIRLGDAVLLWPNTLLGSEPDKAFTMTTVYMDRDFLVDQVFWRNARQLTDRMRAHDLMASRRADAAQVVHLEPDRVGYVSPWLDELVALSVAEMTHERFFRVLSLWFAVLDVVTPFVRLKESPPPMTSLSTRPMIPRASSVSAAAG